MALIRTSENGLTKIEVPAVVVGNAQKNSDAILERLGGQKILVMTVKTATGANVVASSKLQGSIDGTTWVDVATIIADLEPDAAGSYLTAIDLTNYLAVPYWRIAVRQEAVDTTTFAMKSQICFMP